MKMVNQRHLELEKLLSPLKKVVGNQAAECGWISMTAEPAFPATCLCGREAMAEHPTLLQDTAVTSLNSHKDLKSEESL